METITLSRKEYRNLKKNALLGSGLLFDLIEGLEDIQRGRIKLWRGVI